MYSRPLVCAVSYAGGFVRRAIAGCPNWKQKHHARTQTFEKNRGNAGRHGASRAAQPVSCLAELLLPQTADPIHVDGLEPLGVFTLIGGELLVVAHGLEADDAALLADAYEHNPSRCLVPAVGLVLLVGECNVDVGHVAGGVRRQLRVREHGRAVEDDGAGASVGRVDRQTARVVALVHGGQLVVVGREGAGVGVVGCRRVGLAGLADAADEEEGRDQDDAD